MNRTVGVATLLVCALASSAAWAKRDLVYEVAITNLTKGQTFTPILVATHSRSLRMFTLGDPASEALEILAEDGNTGPLSDVLESAGSALGEVTTIGGLLGPGHTAVVRVSARWWHDRLSLGAMLIPTNDTFVALNGVALPRRGADAFVALAYDAGTEFNDQSCANIPGPRCGGEGHSPGPNPGDEGFVHVGNGFHELGDDDGHGAELLHPMLYDWRNPVARVKVRRVR